MAKYFAILVALMMLAGAPAYLRDILKGKTKPQRASWFIWTILGVTAFIAQLKLHGAWSLVFVGMDALGNIVVFCLSLKYGTGGWSISDKIALLVAILSVAVSLVYHEPFLALVGVVLADLSGALLTILKTYRLPDSETTITWLFLGSASLVGALSVGKLDWQLLLYPVYLALANYGVVVSQLAGRLAHQK